MPRDPSTLKELITALRAQLPAVIRQAVREALAPRPRAPRKKA